MSLKIKVIGAAVGAAALAVFGAGAAQAYPTGAGAGTLQEVPAPASGSCADYMSPASINWSGVGGSTWSPTFQNKCVRTFMFDNTNQRWFTR